MTQHILDLRLQFPVEYAVILLGYITPVCFVLTLFATGIFALVLTQPKMKNATNIVLLAIAVADLLTLLFPLPWYVYLYTLGHFGEYVYPAWRCNWFNYMTEILPGFFHTASVWCTVLLACQRLVFHLIL